MFSEYQSFTPKHVNIYIDNNSVSEADDNLVANPEVGNETSSKENNFFFFFSFTPY
jgi:hypothetical protein